MVGGTTVVSSGGGRPPITPEKWGGTPFTPLAWGGGETSSYPIVLGGGGGFTPNYPHSQGEDYPNAPPPPMEGTPPKAGDVCPITPQLERGGGGNPN